MLSFSPLASSFCLNSLKFLEISSSWPSLSIFVYQLFQKKNIGLSLVLGNNKVPSKQKQLFSSFEDFSQNIEKICTYVSTYVCTYVSKKTTEELLLVDLKFRRSKPTIGRFF